MALLERIGRERFEGYRSAFDRDGVVCARGVFDRRSMALLEATIAAAVAEPSSHIEYFGSQEGGGRFFADTALARFPEYEEFLAESPAAELAARLMRSRVAKLFFEQVLVKEPGAEKRTPWHQDLPYWPIAGSQICSMWIPIDRVPHDVSVQFVAGSHRWREHSPCDFSDGVPYGHAELPRLPDIDRERDAHVIRAFDMAPGDCIVFHANIAHGAPGNAAANPRRAISIRWTGDDARHTRRQAMDDRRSVGDAEREGQPLDDANYPVIWSDTAPAA
jgi:ectoine hydroxylase-related dioxygenase (phytanoyl-CoA dioxygenase family)